MKDLQCRIGPWLTRMHVSVSVRPPSIHPSVRPSVRRELSILLRLCGNFRGGEEERGGGEEGGRGGRGRGSRRGRGRKGSRKEVKRQLHTGSPRLARHVRPRSFSHSAACHGCYLHKGPQDVLAAMGELEEER